MLNGKFVSAVICAAGASSRMGMDKSKQLLELDGKAVIEHTVAAFENDGVTDEIVIVCPETLLKAFEELFSSHCTKVIRFAKGGAERQFSVFNGVSSCDESAQLVIIHDGARPFVTPELIESVAADGDSFGCATLAVPVKDTIKRVVNGIAAETPKRDELYAIQTPQVFRKDLYLCAYAHAAKDGIVCTDDCSLVELIGCAVKITPGDYNNIKITTPEDIAIAQAIADKKGDA